MVSKSLFIVFLFGLISCGTTKEVTSPIILADEHDINIAVKAVYLDKLDQLYIVNTDGVLIKYDQRQIEMYRYADRTLGNIQYVDVNNPLNTLVYHAQYGTISYLDNTLAQLRKQNIQDWEFYDISTIASSNDGKIWLYDPAKNVISKLDDNGAVIISSNNLNDYGLQNLQPSKIVERANTLVVQEPSLGLIIFDNLGQFIKVLPLNSLQSFQTDGNNIYSYSDNILHVYTIKLLEESAINLNIPNTSSTLKNVLISPRAFYYVYDNGVSVSLRQ